MTQEEIVVRVIAALAEVGVPYMVAGSFAGNLNGVPRMAQHADIVVDADEEAVLRLVHLLEPDSYVSEEAAIAAVRLRRMFNAIHFDTGFKVDLIIKKNRPFSAEELRRRELGLLAGEQVDLATAEDNILTKLEWAKLGDSERQYSGAVGLIQVQDSQLDRPYLQRWAVDLGVADLLERARRAAPFKG